MGKSWDNSGVSYQVETWAALAEHLLPGAFLMTFGGARSWHRIACAIEDAGLIMHPSIFGWAYGSGFPKATRIDTQIDKVEPRRHLFMPFAQHYAEQRRKKNLTHNQICEVGKFYANHNHGGASSNWELGLNVPTLDQWETVKPLLDMSDEFDVLIQRVEAEREIIGKAPWTNSVHHFVPGEDHKERVHLDVTAPATDLAAQWAGHRYGLQAMKPALEPILLFQKPWEGKRLDCIVETGAGSLNVDGGRIETDESTVRPLGKSAYQKRVKGIVGNYELLDSERGSEYGGSTQGRWPANFTLTHSPDCVRDGVRRVKGLKPWKYKSDGKDTNDIYQKGVGNWSEDRIRTGYADADGREEVANWVCVEGCPVWRLGEQSGERGGHPGTYQRVKPQGRAGNVYDGGWEHREAGETLQTFNDKGTAARFFHNSDWSYEVAERLAASDPVRYQAKAAKRGREAGLFGIVGCPECGGLETETHVNEHGRTVTCRRNDHSTVKPIALTQWLATLLLPPDAYTPRRILVPFSGSGSEAIGALLAGWEHITLVEMSSDYCDIARARLAWWAEQAHGQMWPNVKEILKYK